MKRSAASSSVNPPDWKSRRGLSKTSLPAVLGRDVSGVVEHSRADGFAEGDGVFQHGLEGGTEARTGENGVADAGQAQTPRRTLDLY